MIKIDVKIKEALSKWNKASSEQRKNGNLRDFSDICFSTFKNLLKATLRKAANAGLSKEQPSAFFLIGETGYVKEEKDDKPFLGLGPLQKFKGIINAKVKMKGCAFGDFWTEPTDKGTCLVFLFRKGKIKNENAAKKLLKPLKQILSKYNLKFLFSLEEESNDDQGQTDGLDPGAINFSYQGTAQALNAKAEQVLRELLAQAGETNPVIVSTIRSAEEQATIMYNNIIQYGPELNRKSYKTPALASQVVDAFIQAQVEGKSPAEIEEAVLMEILNVGATNITQHCDGSNPAIDIHPQSLINGANFESVLKASPLVNYFAPPNDPFFHIEVL